MYALFVTCFHAGFLLGLIFDPHDGRGMFLRNVGWLPTDYTALYPRRWYSSCTYLLSDVSVIRFIQRRVLRRLVNKWIGKDVERSGRGLLWEERLRKSIPAGRYPGTDVRRCFHDNSVYRPVSPYKLQHTVNWFRFKCTQHRNGMRGCNKPKPPPGSKRNKKFWEELIAYFPWYDTGHIENDASNNSSIVAGVFVTAVTFLPSRCPATIRGFLPTRYLATIGEIHTQTATWSHRPTLFLQNKESRLINKGKGKIVPVHN
jgi:hypothetical protein